jgi:hypothetical protein
MEDAQNRQRKPMNMGLEEGGDFCALLEGLSEYKFVRWSALECA